MQLSVKMEKFTDSELVAICLSGRKQAFSTLLTRHETRVRNTVHAVYPMTQDVDDLIQETFLQAFLNLSTIRDPAQFRSWVCGIALNLAKVRFRTNARLELMQYGLIFGDSSLNGNKNLVEEQVVSHQQIELLSHAIADLPQAEREAILMIYRDGYSQRETAVKLNTTPNAIKVRAHRGRKRLKTILQNHDEFDTQKETQMIPVTIYDVTKRANTPAEGFDKQALLAPLLQSISPELRDLVIEHSTINWSIPADKLLSKVEGLPEEQVTAIHKVMHPLAPHRVVLLKEEASERILPIWIGPFEAEMIRLQLKQISFDRPLSHDMMNSLLDAGGTAVQSATVSKLHNKVYYGELKINVNGQEKSVDCRPSDALTLATRINCPIFVAPEVMDAEGTVLSQIQGSTAGHYQWERQGKINQFQSIV